MLLLVSTLSLYSCMRDPKALLVIDDSGDGEESSLYELPANSQGVLLTEDSNNSNLFNLLIPAAKMYNPEVYNNGWFYFSEGFEFELPEFIQVSSGEAGPHLLVVSLKRKDDDGLPAKLECAYVGSSAHATVYEFDYCIEGSIKLTEENVDDIRLLPENILDKTMRNNTFLRVNRTDKITVQVLGGNHDLNEATKVEFKLSAQKIGI